MAWKWVETIDEFIERHGGDPIGIVVAKDGVRVPSGWHALPDGAVYSDGGGVRHEPPADELERFVAQLRWFVMAKDRANDRCKQIQGYINQQSAFYAAGAGPLPDDRAYADLEKQRDAYRDFQRRVRAKQNEILRAEKRLGRLTKEHEFERYQARRREEKAEAAEAIQRAQSIMTS